MLQLRMPEKSNRSIHQPSGEAQAALANMKDTTEARVLHASRAKYEAKIRS
jgi:hypothetical protein